MLFIRVLMVASLGMLTAAAASAATTYAWPLQISQKVSLTTVAVPVNSDMSVNCRMYTTANAAQQIGFGAITHIQVPSVASGLATYNGTVVVSYPAPASGVPPQSGNLVTCFVGANNTVVSQVQYTLP